MLSLGFYGAYLDSSYKGLPSAGEDVPLFWEDVLCKGNEQALSQCHHRLIGLHDCDHGEDAGVFCAGKYIQWNTSRKGHFSNEDTSLMRTQPQGLKLTRSYTINCIAATNFSDLAH